MQLIWLLNLNFRLTILTRSRYSRQSRPSQRFSRQFSRPSSVITSVVNKIATRSSARLSSGMLWRGNIESLGGNINETNLFKRQVTNTDIGSSTGGNDPAPSHSLLMRRSGTADTNYESRHSQDAIPFPAPISSTQSSEYGGSSHHESHFSQPSASSQHESGRPAEADDSAPALSQEPNTPHTPGSMGFSSAATPHQTCMIGHPSSARMSSKTVDFRMSWGSCFSRPHIK